MNELAELFFFPFCFSLCFDFFFFFFYIFHLELVKICRISDFLRRIRSSNGVNG